MNKLKKISKYVNKLILRKPSVEEGVKSIKKILNGSFRYYDVRLVNMQAVRQGCLEFRQWLNHVAISQPVTEGVVAIYFGLFMSEEGLQLYSTGSKLWSETDPDWACRSDWRPEGGVVMPDLFREITMVISEFNMAGYFIAVAYTVLLILDFARESMISLLHNNRNALYIACGFDDGELFNVGVMVEGGIVSLKEAEKRGMLPEKFQSR